MLLPPDGTPAQRLTAAFAGAQQADTAEAREALAATAKDMALVTAEQRSLLQQWQAAMQSMRQRDAALQVLLHTSFCFYLGHCVSFFWACWSCVLVAWPQRACGCIDLLDRAVAEIHASKMH